MCRKLAFAATALALIGTTAQARHASDAPAASSAPVAAAPGSGATNPATSLPEALPAPPKPTPEQRAEVERMDPLARAAFWARVVDGDVRDLEAGVKLARALRELARFDDAAAATDRVLVIDPNNLPALMESARARIAQGQGFYAIDPAQRAAALAPRDWRPVALLAVALEQSQRDDEALAAHQKALALAPNEPSTLSNLGMYYAGHGEAAQGEALLRRAVAQPGATMQVRQNLALILGLEGKIAEAERLARQDLPPAMVANNLAYFQAAQTAASGTGSRSWDAMRAGQ